LVKEKKLEGIHALRDESDRSGMRVVVELKHDAFGEVVLNHLYKSTPLQSTFGCILLAIVNQRPRVLSLKEMIQHYIAHRREVVLRRTRYLLKKAKERAHILEGYRIALDHIDEVIALIRASQTTAEAHDGLMVRFGLSDIQATAILEMRLQRLTGLERDKIEEEYAEVQRLVAYYESILGSEELLMGVVAQELQDVRAKYADVRRTRIVDAKGELTMHDLVAEEDQVVTISHLGYIKRVSSSEWKMQKRGGVGKMGMATREEDFVTSIFVANTHAILLVFTTLGKVFPLPVYELPETSRTAKGRPIVHLLDIPPNERIAAVVAVREIEEDDERDLVFVSRDGLIKRTPLSAYKNVRQGGLIAAGVADDDELVVVKLLDPGEDVDIMMLTRRGQCIRFPKEGPKGAPVFGRSARGNKGIALADGDEVVDLLLVPHAEEVVEEAAESDDTAAVDGDGELEEPESTLLTVTELGFGKRTPIDAFPSQGRNGKGVISHKTSDDVGGVVGAREVTPEDQIMLVTNTGRVIRFGAAEVRLVKSRGSKGVRLMRLEEGERIVDLELLVENDEVPLAAAPSASSDVVSEE